MTTGTAILGEPCRIPWHMHAFQKMTAYFCLVLLLFSLPWNRNSNVLGKVVIWSSSKASKTVYFARMFFCRKLPSTQKVATLIGVEKDYFHPLEKNQGVKYLGSRTGGFKCELQFTTHYSSKPRTSTAQKPTFHLSAAQGPDGWLFLPSGSCNQTSHHLLPRATRPHCVSSTGKLNKQLWDTADSHHPSASY